jgi:hypothetical protein
MRANDIPVLYTHSIKENLKGYSIGMQTKSAAYFLSRAFYIGFANVYLLVIWASQ